MAIQKIAATVTTTAGARPAEPRLTMMLLEISSVTRKSPLRPQHHQPAGRDGQREASA